ncbi:hypothetical protein BDN71DRAFT_1454074 [Pleurotus eryngii]|uniref:F-box domain-containing protein n=1 Tax=Pleurotus eryngii TaxID=5323 RepID=A0A9P5ZPZ9_PLEER|nr:hypothetical protein BDN71DRAFT_1454074 [Pleurotus eryngii]
MELSLEAYRNIVKYVGNRADIATLCRVSKSFRHVAQRALYNTLYLRDVHSTISLCGLLAREPRLATLVDALTISFSGAQEGGSDDDSSESGSDEEEASSQPPSASEYWAAVAPALRQTVRLRYLNVHIHNSDTAVAWILNTCTFRLRSFHCDLDWDTHLVSFLNTQPDLDDLYILDYKDPNHAPQHTVSSTDSPIRLLPSALPKLSTLECTFSEAAVALVPGRPVTHLKSCFSRTRLEEKQAEVSLLFSKIKLSTRRLKALDIADASYTETFSMTLLQHVIRTRATVTELRYLGTLVLPIGGQERLQFYGLLMRLPRVQCVEVEVTHWEPPPAALTAFRALTLELRLYCPTVTRVVFVYEFDRTVISVVDGLCVLDHDTSTDILWSEI